MRSLPHTWHRYGVTVTHRPQVSHQVHHIQLPIKTRDGWGRTGQQKNHCTYLLQDVFKTSSLIIKEFLMAHSKMKLSGKCVHSTPFLQN